MVSSPQQNQQDVVQSVEPFYQRRWFILLVLSLCMLLVAIDATVVNVALPLIATELPASTSELQWITEIYTLVLAGLLLTCGTLADWFGNKRFLLGGIALFGVGSACAAFAPTPFLLICARALMGMGGAVLMPTTLSTLRKAFPAEERTRAIAIWSAASSVGVAIGPLVGGWLLSYFWWGSVFLLSVPLALIAMVACVLYVPDQRSAQRRAIDFVGTILSILGMVSLVFALTEGPVLGWTNPLLLGILVLGVVVLVAFVLWERRTTSPMLDISLFSNRQFSISSIATALSYFALFGSLFAITQYLQLVLGFSPLIAGLALLPEALALLVASLMGAELTKRFARKWIVVGGLVLTALGLALLAFITPTSGYLFILVVLILTTGGIGIAATVATDLTLGAVSVERANSAAAVSETALEVGGTLGIAVLGSILTGGYVTALQQAPDIAPTFLRQMVESLGAATQLAHQIGGAEGQRLLTLAQTAFTQASGTAALVGAIMTVIAACLTVVFLPTRSRSEGSPTKEA